MEAATVPLSSLGGRELWLTPVMVVFYVIVPLVLLARIGRQGEDDQPSDADEIQH